MDSEGTLEYVGAGKVTVTLTPKSGSDKTRKKVTFTVKDGESLSYKAFVVGSDMDYHSDAKHTYTNSNMASRPIQLWIADSVNNTAVTWRSL